MSKKRNGPPKRPSLKSERAQERLTARKLMRDAVECRHKIQDIDHRHKRKIRRWLGHAYGIAFQLLRSGRAWLEFTRDDLWKGRRERPRNDDKGRDKVLLWTMRYLLSDGQNDNYNRAYTYARGLQGFFDKGVKPEEIPDLIEEYGGIEALYKQAAKDAKEARVARASDFSFLDDLGDKPELEQKDNSNRSVEPTKTATKKGDLHSFPLDKTAEAVLKDVDRFRDEVVEFLRKRSAGKVQFVLHSPPVVALRPSKAR